MKKNLALVVLLLIHQLVHAQTNPALLTNFKIEKGSGASYDIIWNIANNEVINKFDLQKSTNGVDFTTIAVLSATQKRDAETYKYSEKDPGANKVMYRLKTLSKGQEIYYSNVIILTALPVTKDKISILGNPVKEKLTFRFNEIQTQAMSIRVYDVMGRIMSELKLNKAEKNETINIPLQVSTGPGIYTAEINNGHEKMTFRFVKN